MLVSLESAKPSLYAILLRSVLHPALKMLSSHVASRSFLRPGPRKTSRNLGDRGEKINKVLSSILNTSVCEEHLGREVQS